MAADRKYLYVVMMDVEPEVEADFNRVYDEEHVPGILKVPGVLGASRYETSAEGQPKYLALYEVEGARTCPAATLSGKQPTAESGRPIRPHTKNRRHIVYKRI